MSTPDMDVIKEIPGYKIILKAILKSQIQQLVEQLASHTDEESVILTASVSDGTLSHLGSDSGKTFLVDHEDIKSQFLGFCLKKHHKKKQQEKEKQELLQSIPTTPTRFEGQPFPPQRSPRFSSPRQSIHPIALTRASPGAIHPMRMQRHQPYPMRPQRPNFDPKGPARAMNINMPVQMPASNQVIKIEAEDPDDSQNSADQSTSDMDKTVDPSNSSPFHSAGETAHSVKSESIKDTDANSESSNSTIANEAALSDNVPPEGLGLDSDLSNLMPLAEDSSGGDNLQSRTSFSAPHTPSSSGSGLDPGVNVKVEAITESEMELEITGVELAPQSSATPGSSGLQEGWAPEMQGGGLDYGSPGASGSQADMQQGYKSEHRGRSKKPEEIGSRTVKPNKKTLKRKARYTCCGKGFYSPANLTRHRCSEHNEKKNHVCDLCGRSFAIQADLNRHRRREAGENALKCKTCHFRCFDLSKLQEHEDIHSNVSRFFCEICGQVFRFSANLSRHRKKHMRDLPKCVLCEKVCSSMKMLKEHMKQH